MTVTLPLTDPGREKIASPNPRKSADCGAGTVGYHESVPAAIPSAGDALLAGARTRNLFDPQADAPYKLSRSKLELFLQCPRCFYLDRRRGVGRPDGPPFTLNVAVDALMKREFDAHRAKGEPHELMRSHGIDAVPFWHPSLEEWRDMARGVRHLHAPANFLVFGAVDDIWVKPDGQLCVVDYKATSIPGSVSLEGSWKRAYKRQMEIYQWLLRKNGYDVSDTGYFVYVNADKGKETFGGKLEFQTTILPYVGKDDWVDDALCEARTALCRAMPPQAAVACEWCAYRRAAGEYEPMASP